MTNTPNIELVEEVVEVDAITGEVTRRRFTAEELADRAAMAETPLTPAPPN